MPAQYYSSLKSFITFFYKTNEEMTAAQKAENERKCSLVLKYCETNYRRIGRGEDPNREDEEVQELLRIRPIHIQRWLNQVAYHKEEPGVEDNPIYARSNITNVHSLITCHVKMKRGIGMQREEEKETQLQART